jgi:hypothetical protein
VAAKPKSLLLLAVASLSPSGALAQDDAPSERRVYIVAVPVSSSVEEETARVGAAARAALRTVDGVAWQGPDQLYLGYDDDALARLARAREQLTEGRQAYLDLELERAIELLQSAVADFDAAASALEDTAELGEALLFLGASQVFANQAREARRTFARLHVQMPHVQPDPDTFNPDVVMRYQQSAPRDISNPMGSIRVESEPPNAIVYVDYVPRGRTPHTVEPLAEGMHVVRVTRPGATPYVQEVEISRRSPQASVNAYLADNEQTAGLAEAVEAIATAEVDEVDPAGPIASLASLLELDIVGVIRVGEGSDSAEVRLELLLFDATNGRRLLRGEGPARTAYGQLEPAVERLVRGGLATSLSPQQEGDTENILRGTGPTGDDTDSDDGGGDSIWTRWWFWTAIGAGVAAIALTTALLVTRDNGPQLGNDRGGVVVFEF